MVVVVVSCIIFEDKLLSENRGRPGRGDLSIETTWLQDTATRWRKCLYYAGHPSEGKGLIVDCILGAGPDTGLFEGAPAWWLAFLCQQRALPTQWNHLQHQKCCGSSSVKPSSFSLLLWFLLCLKMYLPTCSTWQICILLPVPFYSLFLIGISANFILPISVYFYFFKSQFKWLSGGSWPPTRG